MRYRLLTPGPSPVPEETLLELAKQVTHHRTAEARQTLAEVVADLKYVFQTQNHVVVLTSSGTGGMEAAVSNVIAPGDKAIALVAGKWGERWQKLCRVYGAELVSVEVPYGRAVSPEQIRKALKDHPDAKAVYCQLSETSTGVGHDIRAFGDVVRGTDALLVVDGISGVAADECRTDDWGVDICVAGSQKALMLPPGLAFVSVSPKAWARIDANGHRKAYYFDLKAYREKLAEDDTPYTPANTLIKAQRVSLKQIRAEGIEAVWERHRVMADAARAGVAALGLELFAERPNNGGTVVKVPDGMDGSGTLKKLEKQYGLKLADGQGTMKGNIWRLAHMGYVDMFDVLAALSGLELVMLEAGRPVELGAGVAAAQRVLAGRVKRA